MATVQTIREGVFMISWTCNNPSYYGQPSEANVFIEEILQSFKLSFKRTLANYTSVLEIEINPISSKESNKKWKVLKPSSVLAIKNGVKQSMQLQNTSWTTTFVETCPCGRRIATSNLDILIDFNLSFMKPDSKRVLDHLLNLWETKTLADVTFKFKEKEVKAHTLIISSGSPVLAAMFHNDFKEKQERVVDIKDIKSTVFEKMLRFFYTGDADLDNVDVADLLIAANKYGVDLLKEECARHLALNLSEKNAIRYLIVSHIYEVPSLRKPSLEFISQNAETIVSKKDWVDLMKNYHELSLAAVQMMVLAKK